MDDMLSRMDPSKLQKDFAEHVRTGEPMPAPTTEFQRDTLARGEMAERLRVAEAEAERLRARTTELAAVRGAPELTRDVVLRSCRRIGLGGGGSVADMAQTILETYLEDVRGVV
jgi:hypothetical protein